MKFVLIMLALMGSFSALALETSFHPIAAIGHRFGEGNLNDENVAYGSLKMTLLGQKTNDIFNELNFLSPGINIQSDGRVTLSLSPVSVSLDNGITFGADLFFHESNERGGPFALFLGYRF